jgi:hypothetical protein
MHSYIHPYPYFTSKHTHLRTYPGCAITFSTHAHTCLPKCMVLSHVQGKTNETLCGNNMQILKLLSEEVNTGYMRIRTYHMNSCAIRKCVCAVWELRCPSGKCMICNFPTDAMQMLTMMSMCAYLRFACVKNFSPLSSCAWSC